LESALTVVAGSVVYDIGIPASATPQRGRGVCTRIVVSNAGERVMRAKLGIGVACVGLLWLVVPVAAHHSFSVEYDANKPIAFEGVVTKIEWTNPHARVYVDVVDKGTVRNWNMELASPSALARNGWSSRTLKVGDKVKVDGFDGRAANTYRLNAKSIVLPDGRSLFSGSADDGR
jgi:hypothetical protein